VRPTDPASAARSAAVETSVVDVPADLHLRQLATLLGLVSGVQAVTLFAVLALPTLATKAAPAFGVGAEAVGYQISLIYVIASLVSSFAGLYVRRYGAATTSFAAVAMAAIALAGFASGDLAVAAICSIICGAAYGITNPAASHLLWRFAPPARRNLIFAIKQTGTPLGGMLASLLLPALSMWLGWRGAIFASLALFTVIALPLLFKRPVWDEDRDPGARIRGSLFNGVRAALGHPTLRGLAIVGLSYAGYQFCLFSFVVTMLVVDFEWRRQRPHRLEHAGGQDRPGHRAAGRDRLAGDRTRRLGGDHDYGLAGVCDNGGAVPVRLLPRRLERPLHG
jgi:MFS family permease